MDCFRGSLVSAEEDSGHCKPAGGRVQAENGSFSILLMTVPLESSAQAGSGLTATAIISRIRILLT